MRDAYKHKHIRTYERLEEDGGGTSLNGLDSAFIGL